MRAGMMNHTSAVVLMAQELLGKPCDGKFGRWDRCGDCPAWNTARTSSCSRSTCCGSSWRSSATFWPNIVPWRRSSASRHREVTEETHLDHPTRARVRSCSPRPRCTRHPGARNALVVTAGTLNKWIASPSLKRHCTSLPVSYWVQILVGNGFGLNILGQIEPAVDLALPKWTEQSTPIWFSFVSLFCFLQFCLLLPLRSTNPRRAAHF